MVCYPKIEVHLCCSRFDSEGQLLECASISDVRGGPAAGTNTNWKTLFEAKSENLGQGDKVKLSTSLVYWGQNKNLDFMQTFCLLK